MKLTEIVAKQPKITKHARLLAVGKGEKPDADLIPFLQKMGTAAEKAVLQDVLADPDNFGIDYDTTAREIRQGATIYTMAIVAHENGFEAKVNASLDDVGGDSTNYEEKQFDVNGKMTEADIGDEKIAFDEQADWKQTDHY